MKSRDRVLWVDGTAGASGDMVLGALVDLGVPLARIRAALDSLPLDGWRIASRRVTRAGLIARKVDVRVTARAHRHGRGWQEIRRIVEGGKLPAEVRSLALKIFRRLIEAEAEVHGIPADRVHLHELGATDAIVDVVGACVGLAHLAPRRIVASTLTTGHGSVRCAHGTYPVPGPATLRLVRNVPVRGGDVEMERLTPTGAAILTTVVDAWGPLPAMRPIATGYGAGDLDPGGDPNFLVMVLGEAEPDAAEIEPAPVAVLEFNVDDAPPQNLAYAVERLLEEGAREVYTTPVQMKKGRAGHHLTVLARPEDLRTLARVVLRETTTLGMRYRREERIELERSVTRVKTPWGAVRVKVGHLDGQPLQAWPEYEDCAALARRRRVPLKEVQMAALEAWRGQEGAAGRRQGRGRGR